MLSSGVSESIASHMLYFRILDTSKVESAIGLPAEWPSISKINDNSGPM